MEKKNCSNCPKWAEELREYSKVLAHRRVDECKLVQVILTKMLFGVGTEDDPVRTITQFWSKEGDLLAISDEALPKEKAALEVQIQGRQDTHTISMESLSCLMQHFVIYHRQAIHEEPADFIEPCTCCPMRQDCDLDWITKLIPIGDVTDIRFNLARLAHSEKQGTGRGRPGKRTS